MRHHPDREPYEEDAREQTGPMEPVARSGEAVPPAGDVLSDGWDTAEERGPDGDGESPDLVELREPGAVAYHLRSPDLVLDGDASHDAAAGLAKLVELGEPVEPAELAEPGALGADETRGADGPFTAQWTPDRDEMAAADREADRDVARAIWGPEGDDLPRRRRGRLLLAAVTGVVAVGLAGGWFLSSVGSAPEPGCSAGGRCVKAEMPPAPTAVPTEGPADAPTDQAQPAETTPPSAEERATAAPETSRPAAPRTRAPRPERARATPTARRTSAPTGEREERRGTEREPRVTSAPSAEAPDSRQSTAPEQPTQPAQPSAPAEATAPAQNPPPEKERGGGLLDWLF
ncbi:hypothetical protein AB0D67_15935 [Streptosporangium sp. NPDC048047]|uniref:hypothetical protein n=1 Tax=Streptosporangium sp. NPDC048047 TaxID=3155748 RepID=UPI003437726B